MTEKRRLSFIAVAALFAAIAAPACGDDENPGTPGGGKGGKGGTGGSAGTAGASATGGTGGTGPDGGGGTIDIRKAAEAPNPFDATPDPDGQNVYFTAVDPMLGAGVFKIPAGGGAVTAVHAGPPFAGPFGIATSTDGNTLFVADPASEWTDSAGVPQDGGQIFSLSPSGGTPASIMGTTGYSPRGLEVHQSNGTDEIYFSGRDSAGVPGVFKVATGGGTPSALASGSPFVDPSGVAVSAAGDVYVADTSNAETRSASILLVKGGTTSVLASDLRVGYPVGIALAKDDKTLFVSGLNPDTLNDIVFAVDVATKGVSTYEGSAENKINQFFEPAGLHRAKKLNVFAWADSKAAGGSVYVLTIE
jgi:DNA-binding beta-propeller fold protein YncE